MIHQPFELDYWFVQVFSGSQIVFILISTLVISFLCARMRISTSAFVAIIAVYGGILASWGQSWIQIAFIILLAPLWFWLWRKAPE